MALQHPTGKIVDQGVPLVDQVKVKTAANCYPGRLVIKDTTDNQIKVSGAAGETLGWLGYEQAALNYKPDTVDTIYAVNDMAPLLYGGHFTIVASLASGESVAAGARLVAGANGELIEDTAAIATTGSATASVVDATTPTIDGSVGSDGIIVAIARETVDASAAAKDILVLSLI